MIHAPRRAARYVRRARNDDSTAMSIAELPIPSTTTWRSRNSSGSSPVYACECICTPAKRSCPGNGGSGPRGSQWWPLATIRASYARVPPGSTVTSQPPPARGTAWVTRVSNVIRSRSPKWST